jgi:hypothetical protein
MNETQLDCRGTNTCIVDCRIQQHIYTHILNKLMKRQVTDAESLRQYVNLNTGYCSCFYAVDSLMNKICYTVETKHLPGMILTVI